jgi:hypothetical protein
MERRESQDLSICLGPFSGASHCLPRAPPFAILDSLSHLQYLLTHPPVTMHPPHLASLFTDFAPSLCVCVCVRARPWALACVSLGSDQQTARKWKADKLNNVCYSCVCMQVANFMYQMTRDGI